MSWVQDSSLLRMILHVVEYYILVFLNLFMDSSIKKNNLFVKKLNKFLFTMISWICWSIIMFGIWFSACFLTPNGIHSEATFSVMGIVPISYWLFTWASRIINFHFFTCYKISIKVSWRVSLRFEKLWYLFLVWIKPYYIRRNNHIGGIGFILRIKLNGKGREEDSMLMNSKTSNTLEKFENGGIMSGSTFYYY